MNALQKLQAAIRKFLGLTKPPRPNGVMLDDPQTASKPAATLIMQGVNEAEADRAAAAIQADIERAIGHPVTLIHLGHVTVKLKPITACNCPDCQRRRKAPWN